MCGRYALSLRPSQVRSRLANFQLDVDDAPEDDDEHLRQTYNFAPSYHGLIYRAQAPGNGDNGEETSEEPQRDDEPAPKGAKIAETTIESDGCATKETRYRLQAARWGLIPFWTKRPPDYGSQMKTINCRNDSLIEDRGMWNTMKKRKRCIVVAEGFYEWLKKNNGKEKIPHFVKRKDGELMLFAGLWDMVQYEGSEEKLYTYTIITTDSNKQLNFLHDRMPVILEPGSQEMKDWLDPNFVGWSKELQSMLKPYDGELDCYPVDQAVGKVGNNSPSFVIPIDSKENKNNIANFFSKQKTTPGKSAIKEEADSKDDSKTEIDDARITTSKVETSEDNAPLPKVKDESDEDLARRLQAEEDAPGAEDVGETATPQSNGKKRKTFELGDTPFDKAARASPRKAIKVEK